MGRIKTTITVDSDLWKRFLKILIEKYGTNIGEVKKRGLDEAIKLLLEKKR